MPKKKSKPSPARKAAMEILTPRSGAANAFVPRVVSLIALLAVVLLTGALFFRVVAQFVVPLFLAGVLVVVFEPVHRWFTEKLPGRRYAAAGATTTVVMLTVLIPTIWLGVQAYLEGRQVALYLVGEGHQGTLAESFEKRIVDAKEFYKDQMGTEKDPDFAPLGAAIARYAGTAGLNTVLAAVGIVVGLVVMTVALFYFLADGPAMIEALTHLSPLDDEYEHELLQKFSEVSRAVVVATLLSAVVQGLLGGIGYYFALEAGAPILLLTVLTIVLAIIPFVGATAVWIPVCIWIFLFQTDIGPDGEVQRHWAAVIGLAIYGTAVVSSIDNVIKPMVLHGNAKLHPLLALLSVLGGVSVLGPVGILVGPMLVAFLQAMLGMLRRELDRFNAEHAEAEAEAAQPQPA
ncbi:putative inner membrane protein [Pirellulimonas nuda]|uniref:Putative inner membrane protein n=1 Tax=Pirellulimonas nuda TaxID=2528009 RepID=A0A518DFI7_9BACT|nr:AI-2E family transporter [Pirellulimonas nuda]QDU90226.1 putative inner membrane protein [Pirellulimonas nuda]